jgi:RNA polymerase sigma-70 factor (ECF subfamily)
MKGERRFRRWATDAREAHADRVPTWEEIAHDYGRFLYTVCYRLTGNDHEAQDLVQEVLLRVRRGLATYQPGSMEGWLSRIATNAFLDDVRRQKRRPVEALPDDPERVLEGAPSADEALDNASLPDHVQQALRELPDDYRAAVVLCDVVGFSYQEIAESLDVPVGTVRSRIHRGRSLLKEALS